MGKELILGGIYLFFFATPNAYPTLIAKHFNVDLVVFNNLTSILLISENSAKTPRRDHFSIPSCMHKYTSFVFKIMDNGYSTYGSANCSFHLTCL